MKGKIGDKQRLLHIIEAIEEIESYTNKADSEEFLTNSIMRFASIKQIEIIGEAPNLISEETIIPNYALRKISDFSPLFPSQL